ncbi:hypothetical protein F7R15_19940 [Pseudomonas reinekei]|uniref:Uncharacterized protein n=1 Tax=Pseudomonas reinekei TaxID=395598 RepID=A0A6H9RHD2_PSERE|nr:hypothetical protein F7R15_19940 [Pseudomonas reinekei]
MPDSLPAARCRKRLALPKPRMKSKTLRAKSTPCARPMPVLKRASK